MSERQVYVGLMSGTSLDGVDAVAMTWHGEPAVMRLLGHRHRPFPDALRSVLLALNTPGANELHLAALASNGIARQYAEVTNELLEQRGLNRTSVRALGAHGQTVRHRPGEFDGNGYTLQLLNAALLAELTGIDVVCDFRSRDVAAGGQGAPLVPAFHRAMFGGTGAARAVLNIGGMANLTLLQAGNPVLGFDCGPGNVLMDLWCERHLGRPFDEGGAWASSGHSDETLLAALMADEFIRRPPPKSTGRDHFHADWLDARLQQLTQRPAPADVQATLLEFTAASAVSAVRASQAQTTQLLVCGGGALNAQLLRRLAILAPDMTVDSTATAGLDPMHVESAAFAWLASAFIQRRPGNIRTVTGAAGERVLGALYPA